MIKVEKNFDDIPSILKSTNRREAFEKNIEAKKYVFGKTLYKTKKVQTTLNKIYHLKCAFCEQKLLDSPKHIEHYRPKNTYYWLAYSWDNLLLACGSCNSFKDKRFKIKNAQVVYDNESFDDIHSLGNSYDDIEKPLIINPEKDDILGYIKYNIQAKVSSDNKRVKHTIENACKLNREELVKKRLPVLNDFINKINEHYFYFESNPDITRFIPEIKSFLEKCNNKNEFYSFRYFIINNIDMFFENNNIQKIVKSLISKIK